MGSSFNWLHVSDLHFKLGDTFNRDLVLNAFLESLPTLLGRVAKPDVIFFTGDIAFSGKAQEYKLASQFFDKLLDIMQMNKESLFVIPGNHDVDRSSGIGLARTLDDIESSDDYFNPEKDLFHVRVRQKSYADWHKEYFGGGQTFSFNSTVSQIITIDNGELRIGVLPINSATFSYDDYDENKLWIGRRCLNDSFKKLNELELDLKIGLMHHPIFDICDKERTQIESGISKNLDLLLRGHLHETDVRMISGMSGSVLHLAAGALYQTTKWPNKAMFGFYSDGKVSVLPIRFDEDVSPVWTVDTGLFPDDENFYGHFDLKNEVSQNPTNIKQLDATIGDTSLVSQYAHSQILRKELDDSLFLSPDKTPLEIEPRLLKEPHSNLHLNDESLQEVKLSEIVYSKSSYFIEARPEYGGTILCKQLMYEFSKLGQKSTLKNAEDLPNYQKKLKIEFSEEISAKNNENVLILDNFDFSRDERLLNEINSLKCFSRYIIISNHNRLEAGKLLDIEYLKLDFEHLFIWPLNRSSIRELSQKLFLSKDDEFASRVVDKVYSDLLGLCIPLTPSNVIMYLKVVNNDGEFHPLNGVEILNRHLEDCLRSPSDVYADTFNAQNKMDVLSKFAHKLYSYQKPTFNSNDWKIFCDEYQNHTYTEFNIEEFLAECCSARIFVEYGGLYYFKYKFYYVYFLGHYIASNQSILKEFLEGEDYLSSPDLINVITSKKSDNSDILEELNSKLDEHNKTFSREYISEDFDPLSQLPWKMEGDDSRIWKPVKKELEKGAKPTKEIDESKNNLFSERKSADQKISFSKLTELQFALFSRGKMLGDALRNSDNLSGETKLEALKNILKSHYVSYQIGSSLSPILCKYDLVGWGGLGFIGFKLVDEFEDEEHAITCAIQTIVELGIGVVNVAFHDLGTRKLAPMFHRLVDEVQVVEFSELLLFGCILYAKGSSWELALTSLIEKTDKRSYLLYLMLRMLISHQKNEILLGSDIEKVHRLVAYIQAKRAYKKNIIRKKVVDKAAEILADPNSKNPIKNKK